MGSRILYEVRIREQISPVKWMKKSKFYTAASPSEARGFYKGPGHIMWVEKVSKEKLMGVGEFFSMGKKLMREFSDSDGTNEESTLLGQLREDEKERYRKKRFSVLKHRREEVA
jgi:hypothetical protein